MSEKIMFHGTTTVAYYIQRNIYAFSLILSRLFIVC